MGPIGRGGMGEVVLAEHLGLGKQVVVKLLHQEFAKNAALVKRMQIEARSLAVLASPHIVQVTDFGQTATGRTYIVMERLLGCTLGAEVKARGALPVVEAIGYVLQVLAGLDAAHAMGIIHRDIKPENVFLCDATKDSPRTVKILDFGVAKVLDVAAELERPAIPHLVTEEGGIVGTPRVVAPEQALGKAVDARTDVYATGLLLYTLVVGRGPFAHITDACELLKANVMDRPEPPSARTQQNIPPALDAAVQRALEKRPVDRFQSAEAFAVELRRIAAELVGPRPAMQVPTGPFLPAVVHGVAAPAQDDRPDDPTMQLSGNGSASAPASATALTGDAGHEPTLPARSGLPASGVNRRPAHAEAASLSVRPQGPPSWGAFVALTLPGAAVSAILSVALSHVMP